MKRIRLFLVVVVVCVGSVLAFLKYLYPYGRRPGGVSLQGVYGTLLAYASDHDGWLPQSEFGAYDALQRLYEYCPGGRELAGISGNMEEVASSLKNGEQLDSSLTSWVYVPGFRLGDPDNIAILWESRPGLNWDGRRNYFGGRAVLLLGGSLTNVPASSWKSFLAQQDELRKTVLKPRPMDTNSFSGGKRKE